MTDEPVITPTGRRALLELADAERHQHPVDAGDVHPAARLRLIAQGHLAVDTNDRLHLTPAGRRAAHLLQEPQ